MKHRLLLWGVEVALLGVVGASCGTPAKANPPPLPPHRGSILVTPRIVTVVGEGEPLTAQLSAFCTGLGQTTWWNGLASTYGLKSPLPCAQISGPALTQDIADPDIQNYITQAATNGGIPLDGNNLFLFYLPSGVTATSGQNVNTDCDAFLGYHNALAGRSDTYAVMQRCAPESATVSEIAGEMLNTASHEIAEAVTDALPFQGYVFLSDSSTQVSKQSIWSVLGQGGEVGDLCEGTGTWIENGYKFERYWSNTTAVAGEDPCAPLPDGPYFTGYAAHDWYSIGSGDSLAIPIEGYSTVPTDDWIIYSTTSYRSAVGFASSIDSSHHEPFSGTTYAEINLGKGAQLNVIAPQAPSGSFAVFRIWSKTKSTMNASPDDPSYHLTYWPVGVYIR